MAATGSLHDLLSKRQIISIADATARINIWHGSIRSGKTFASLLAFVMALASAPPAGLVLITGRTLDTIGRNVMEPLTDPGVLSSILAGRIKWTPGAKTAIIMGRTVHLIGANDRRSEGKLRGATVCMVYVDEATLMPRDFFRQLLGRMSIPGARMFATTNPDNPGHWLRKEFIQRADELNLRHWKFGIDDNPSLDPGYVSDLKAEYTGLWYRRFILGAWVQADGAVYESWDDRRHVVDVLPQITDWLGLGIDYGTTNPFAALILGLGTDGRLYLTREWRWEYKTRKRQLTDVEYSRALRDWLPTVPIPGSKLTGVQPRWWVVDPSATSFRVQLHQDGIASKLADNEVTPGVRTLASLIATDRFKVHRSCQGFIDEVPGYSWDPAEAERGRDVPVKADDHSLDAGRYVVYTTRVMWERKLRKPEIAQAA